MPQVASDPLIRPVRPEPSGRPAAADEPSGAFGEILEAAAGPSSPRLDGSEATRKTDGTVQSKLADEVGQALAAASEDVSAVSVQPKSASAPAAIPVNDGHSAPEATGSAVMAVPNTFITIDLAILAQAVEASSGTGPLPAGSNVKAADADKVDANADTAGSDKTDDSDDASIALPDGKTVAIPTTAIVASGRSATGLRGSSRDPSAYR